MMESGLEKNIRLLAPERSRKHVVRYKKLFGDALNARDEKSRLVESVIVCNILNQFRLLGKPKYELAG